jgi:hypothetical protein
MFSTTRWTGLVATLATAIVMLTGQPAAASINRTYGFEHGFGGWQEGYFGEGSYTMYRTSDQSYDGQYSVECYVDGAQASGTAWLTQSYSAPAQAAVKVKLTFQLFAAVPNDIRNFPVVAYVGTTPPRSEADFQVIGYADTVAGWQQFTLEQTQLTGRSPTYLWVAFGISSVWPFSREYNMDHVTVSLKS